MHINRPMRILCRKGREADNAKTTAESYVFAEDSSQEERKGQMSDGPRKTARVNPIESALESKSLGLERTTATAWGTRTVGVVKSVD